MSDDSQPADAPSTEDISWDERKRQIREQYWAELQQKPTVAELLGGAPSVPTPSPPLLPDPEPPSPELTEVETPSPPSTTPRRSGVARLRAALRAVRSGRGGSSRAPGTSATPATATAPNATPPDLPSSGTPAASTNATFDASTVWMVTPIGYVENPTTRTIVDPSGSLAAGLPPHVQSSLQALATGRNEPVEAVVQQIAEFFVESEDERAEGTLRDALIFYVENYA